MYNFLIKQNLKNSMLQTDWYWSLTCGDGPHFAPATQASLVSCIDVAVIVGGGMQALHHCGGVGGGQVERLSGGLRLHQQEIVFRWGYFSPLDHDRSTWNCPANYYLRCVGNWERWYIAALCLCVMPHFCAQSCILNLTELHHIANLIQLMSWILSHSSNSSGSLIYIFF